MEALKMYIPLSESDGEGDCSTQQPDRVKSDKKYYAHVILLVYANFTQHFLLRLFFYKPPLHNVFVCICLYGS